MSKRLFDMFPDLQAEMLALTHGGKPVYLPDGTENPEATGPFTPKADFQPVALQATKVPHLHIVQAVCGSCGRRIRSTESSLCARCSGQPGHRKAA